MATGRIFASPLARRLASDLGIDLRTLKGSGPGGRIVKRDVEVAPRGAFGRPVRPRRSPLPSSFYRATSYPAVDDSSRRRKRLIEAKQTVPHFYLTSDVDMEARWHSANN